MDDDDDDDDDGDGGGGGGDGGGDGDPQSFSPFNIQIELLNSCPIPFRQNRPLIHDPTWMWFEMIALL